MDKALFILVAGVSFLVSFYLFIFWRKSRAKPSRPAITDAGRREPVMGGTLPIQPPPALVKEVIRTEADFPDLPDDFKVDVHYIVKMWQDQPKALDDEAFKGLMGHLAGNFLGGEPTFLAYGPDEDKWTLPRLETLYSCYFWSTPLANRSGRLTEDHVRSIEGYVTAFAAKHDFFVSLPRTDETLRNIDLLDNFCSEVDQVIGIYLAAMPGDRSQRNTVQSICELACAEGFVEDRNGDITYFLQNQRLFILKARNGGKLGQEPATRVLAGLKFEMDIPQLSDPASAFDTMVEHAGKLAQSLHFSLVNDKGVPISNEDLKMFREQIVLIREKMDQYGVVAGSTIARTLFN